MISFNETIDFDFFEPQNKNETNHQEHLKKASICSTDSFLDIWSYETGSLRYSGSHKSLLNNLAFENVEVKFEENHNKEKWNDNRKQTNGYSESKCEKEQFYNSVVHHETVKRTIATASDSIESDVSSISDISLPSISFAPDKEILEENKETQLISQKIIPTASLNKKDDYQSNEFHIDSGVIKYHIVCNDDILQNRNGVTILSVNNDEQQETTDNINLEDQMSTRQHVIKNTNDDFILQPSKEHKDFNEQSKEILDTSKALNALEILKNKRKSLRNQNSKEKGSLASSFPECDDIKTKNGAYVNQTNIFHEGFSDNDMLYSSKDNYLITTVVEVHAENNLYDSLSEEKNTEEIIKIETNNNRVQDGIESDKINNNEKSSKDNSKGITKENKTEKTNMASQHEKLNDIVEINQSNEQKIKDKEILLDKEMTSQTQNDFLENNQSKNQIKIENDLNQTTNEKENITNNEIKQENNIVQTNNIKSNENNYDIDLYNINYLNKYKEIEKKINTANKEIINVKETQNQTKLECLSKRDLMTESKMNINTRIKNISHKTRITSKMKEKNKEITKKNETWNVDYNKRDKIKCQETISGDLKINDELPKLKIKTFPRECKVGNQRNGQKINKNKIPNIKNDNFDMKLLLRTINDLEHTNKSIIHHQRSNSGRSSENSSNKSNSSVHKKINMSFTKDEQKKIDRQNEILLKKIMNQRPQCQIVTNVIRRKPTAYINRLKLQDQISHDNTILKQKIQSINKRRWQITLK